MSSNGIPSARSGSIAELHLAASCQMREREDIHELAEEISKLIGSNKSGALVSISKFTKATTMVRRMIRELKREGVFVECVSRREIFVWLILEIIDTNVAFNECDVWLRHDGTLEEILFAEDGIIGFFQRGDTAGARDRYESLLKKHLN